MPKSRTNNDDKCTWIYKGIDLGPLPWRLNKTTQANEQVSGHQLPSINFQVVVFVENLLWQP